MAVVFTGSCKYKLNSPVELSNEEDIIVLTKTSFPSNLISSYGWKDKTTGASNPLLAIGVCW